MSKSDELSPKSRESLDDVNLEDTIYVITRTGQKEILNTDRIVKRLQMLTRRAPKINHINPHELMLIVAQGLKSGITTYEIDEYAGNAAASLSVSNPHYMKLAARIIIDNHQKLTDRSFVDKMRKVYLRLDTNGVVSPMVSSEFFKYVEKHQDIIEPMIDYSRDFLFDFFGFRTFQAMYGFIINGRSVERPQDLYMRTAIALHMNTCDRTEEGLQLEISRIRETYTALSLRTYTQASPTYFNAGAVQPQYSSCFLLGSEDSRKGIMHTADSASEISKLGGGIGIHIHNWRSKGSFIRGTNGYSNGIVPFLKIYNNTMVAFNQGGRRPGSAAIYLMPHHPDIEAFLKLRLPSGIESERARELFYAVWIPNIFMERIRDGGKWSLFDPSDCGDLSDYYDSKQEKSYTNRYLELESQKKYKKQIAARDLWELVVEANKIKGAVYICFSDWVNQMSMQQNIGVIKSSNLCSEISIYSDSQQYGTCNLCSVSLPACVIDRYTEAELLLPEQDRRQLDHDFPINPYFDNKKLIDIVKIATVNLNNIIDKNYYPTIECERSNKRHRPIGIGLQGLADTYMKLRLPFDGVEAKRLNKLIAETMYFAALSQSTRMCKEEYLHLVKTCKAQGYVKLNAYNSHNYEDNYITYSNYKDIPKNVCAYPSMLWNGGSPISKGVFHWELYELSPSELSGLYDWEALRGHILTYGVKNSLLIALMPTASTSQFLGNNECFEPYTSNLYKRATLAGEFIMINKWLINDLYRLGLWSLNMKDYLIACEGSIQHIDGIPDEIKALYKTAWEINQEELIQQAIDRQPFVDQAQSLNWYMPQVKLDEFTKLTFKAWKGKLKTAKYYQHSKAAVAPQKFSIDPALQKEMIEKLEKEKHLRSDKFMTPKSDEQICDLCGA